MLRKWLVCVDTSEDASFAFNECLRLMDQKNDKLYIICLNEILETFLSVSHIPSSVLTEANSNLINESRRILHHFSRIAKLKNIQHQLVSGRTSHIGDSICFYAKKEDIDFIVIGRRSMSGFRRFFSGSTSKYVMENAECTVIVVKPGEAHLLEDVGVPASYKPVSTERPLPSEEKHTHDFQVEEKAE